MCFLSQVCWRCHFAFCGPAFPWRLAVAARRASFQRPALHTRGLWGCGCLACDGRGPTNGVCAVWAVWTWGNSPLAPRTRRSATRPTTSRTIHRADPSRPPLLIHHTRPSEAVKGQWTEEWPSRPLDTRWVDQRRRLARDMGGVIVRLEKASLTLPAKIESSVKTRHRKANLEACRWLTKCSILSPPPDTDAGHSILCGPSACNHHTKGWTTSARSPSYSPCIEEVQVSGRVKRRR